MASELTIVKSLTDNLLKLINNKKNQNALCTQVIDPLINYIKQRLKFVFIVIIVLLSCVFITNTVIIIYLINYCRYVTNIKI